MELNRVFSESDLITTIECRHLRITRLDIMHNPVSCFLIPHCGSPWGLQFLRNVSQQNGRKEYVPWLTMFSLPVSDCSDSDLGLCPYTHCLEMTSNYRYPNTGKGRERGPRLPWKHVPARQTYLEFSLIMHMMALSLLLYQSTRYVAVIIYTIIPITTSVSCYSN